MNTDPADRAFARYRETGDIAALGSLFDLVAPELLRVSAHLTRDVHAAEDLVQETFVAAMQARDAFDAERRVVPWLVGILTKRAALHHRRRARTIAPGDRPDSAPAEPSEVMAEREVSHTLADAVHALPSPYREVVVRRLRNGQSTSEIAAALERAPGTVRVQLSRGLDLLRKALPIGLAGSCAESSDGRGLDAIKQSVLERARELAVPTAASATSVGVGAVAAWIIGGVAVLVLATAAWRLRADESAISRSEPAVAHAQPSSTETAMSASDALPDDARSTVAVEPPVDIAAAADAAPAPGWILRVRASGPTDVARTLVTARAGGAALQWPADLVAPAHVGSDGALELDVTAMFTRNQGVQPSELFVRADHPDCVPLETRIDVPAAQRTAPPEGHGPWIFEAPAVLERASSVAGRVLDEDGTPVRGAVVALVPYADGAPSGDPLDRAESAMDGAYVLRTNRSVPVGVLALAQGLRPGLQRFDLTPRDTRTGVDVVLERGAHVRGRSNAPRREGDGLRVTALRRQTGGRLYSVLDDPLLWERDRFEWWYGPASAVAADGTFSIEGLGTGSYELLLRDDTWPPVATTNRKIDVVAPADSVVFDVAWTRLDVVVTSAGAPLANADCLVKPSPERGGGVWIRTDERGRASIEVDADVPCALLARAAGHADESRTIRTANGATTSATFDLVRASATLALHVTTGLRAGPITLGFLPLDAKANRDARWWPANPIGAVTFDRTAELVDGRCTVGELPLGEYEVRIEQGTRFGVLDSPWYHAPIVVDLTADAHIERSVELVSAGRLRVEIRDARSVARRCTFAFYDEREERMPVVFVTRLADGNSFAHAYFLGDSGANLPAESASALPPGRYTLVVGLQDKEQRPFPVVIEAGAITPLVIQLDGE